jgi:ATP-binding cassette, subfamily B, bacterial
VLNTTLDRGRLNNQVGTLTAALGFAGPVALLLCGAVMTLNGSLEIGAMLALSSVGAAFLTPVGALASMWTQLQTLRSYLERLEDLLDTPTERRSEAGQSRPPLQGRIELRDVSFAYSPAGPNVVDRVNLQIEPGEFIAIVGPSGSGKSTLARLLGGMHAASSGSLSFEGIDAKAWDPGELRGTLGIVTQDPRLLAATVRDNISLFDTSIPLLRVQEAARLAEIHDDIAKLPLGYDTVLSDGGGSLSGGQRQRLALARALLREPSVVVLDEATSALDTMTERVLHQRLAAMCCTRIVIAHRMTTIRDANRIVVLDAGRVVDIGPHSELLARCRLYRELTGMPTSERTLTPLLDLG